MFNYISSLLGSYPAPEKEQRYLSVPLKWTNFSSFMEQASLNKYGSWEFKEGGRTYCMWTRDKQGKQHVYIQEQDLYMDKNKEDLLDGTVDEEGNITFDRQKFSPELSTTQKIVQVVVSTLSSLPKEDFKAKEKTGIEVAALLKKFREEKNWKDLGILQEMKENEVSFFLSQLSDEEFNQLQTMATGIPKLILKEMARRKSMPE